MTKLLTKSANILLGHGFEQTETTHQSQYRSTGIRHTAFVKNGEEFHLGAKEYAYKGLASFGKNQVVRASNCGAVLVLYIDDEDVFYAFDSSFVEQNGETIIGNGKLVDNQEWVNIPLNCGVTLGKYIRGEEKPETLAGDNNTIDAYL